MNKRLLLLGAVVALQNVRCASGYGEMTLVVKGLSDAIGTWSQPELVNLVVYAPRPAGAPAAEVRFADPSWDSAREERRITTWNGANVMSFVVAWPLGEIDSVRVEAVIAAGHCGSERVVIASGTVRSVRWPTIGSAEVPVVLERRANQVANAEVGACL
jgi:hypothetical protein